MGGAQALNYLVSLFRIKIVAVLLGPSGVGLVGLYSSAMSLLGATSGLGIGSSAVREVVQAQGNDNSDEVSRTVKALRRACLATGVLGWLLAIVLSNYVSVWISGVKDHALALGILGATLLVGAISSGQIALLQGLRRIGDIARINVLSVLVSTVLAIALYALLGAQGIVPVLLTTALINLGFSFWFSSRIHLAPVEVSFAETLTRTKRLIGLGTAFMWSAVLTTGLDMLARSIITHTSGLDSAGIYQAAWGLSGMFAAFILGAMGTDFYPRLTGVIHHRQKTVRAVNEQTEIGILLALPGLLATLAFAPLIIHAFYSKQFLPAALLLPWMVLGVFGRVISWPLGFIQLAMGASRWFVATETIFSAIQAMLLFGLVTKYGAIGAAYAFALTYGLYALCMVWVGHRLIGFAWSSSVKRLLMLSSLSICISLTLPLLMPQGPSTVIAGLITVTGTLISIRGLAKRLGAESKLVKLLHSLPGGRLLLLNNTDHDLVK